VSFQSPLETVSWEVSRAHVGWQTVPYLRSGNSETASGQLVELQFPEEADD